MTSRSKTPSFRTSMVVVPGQDCPKMDHRRVSNTLPYTSPTPLSRRVIPFCLPTNVTQRSRLLNEIQGLLDKVLVQVPASQLDHAAFYASMFLVPKPNGTFRPILNVSNQNVYIDCPHFKMETVKSVRASVRPADW